MAGSIRHQTLELKRLAQENEGLMERVDTLLQLQAREQVSRQQLQTRIDRLSEDLDAPTVAREREALGNEIRRGVTEDLKPFLLAIIDLLDLSIRRAPVAPVQPKESETPPPPSDRAPGAPKAPPEDLPEDLPEILTTPLDELVRPGRAKRQAGASASDRKGAKRRLFKRSDPDTAERIGTAPANASRANSWTPVISAPPRTKPA